MKKTNKISVLAVFVMLVGMSFFAMVPRIWDDDPLENGSEPEIPFEESAGTTEDASASSADEGTSGSGQLSGAGHASGSDSDSGSSQGTCDALDDSGQESGQESSKVSFVEVPIPEDTESEFSYSPLSAELPELGVETPVSGDDDGSNTPEVMYGPPADKDKGGKLGNAPNALYKVLEKFLAKGKAPPPNFPVPYVIYTNSSGIETFTDVLTKMPIMINVDDNKDTGKGNGKDIRVKTTIDVNPMQMTTYVELLDGPPAPDLEVFVTFPAFFYNGEAGDPDGEPYWLYGYATEPGSVIPGDITMTFAVDQSLGREHVFDFDWVSESGIDPLRFTFGTFQVLDKNTSAPIFPAFAEFVVSSPAIASLTFETQETDTMTRKCMYWTAIAPFYLSFDFSEIENLTGINYNYPMTITIDEVPQSMSICTVEDRAANTYSVDYVASSTIDLLQLETEIVVSGIAEIEIDLQIIDMPAEFHAVLGDGYLDVNVTSNVGLVSLDATADIGLAGIDSMINIRLRIYDIPSFSATWFQDETGNGFALDAESCLGAIELAFSFGILMLPIEHSGDPDSHYLFAWSDPATTAIAIRVLDLSYIGFEENNNEAYNTLTLELCDNHILYVIVHTEVGSLLTPDADVDLRIVMDETPTLLTLTWTVPYTLTITTNDGIDSIIGDLTFFTTPPLIELTAHIEILDIPANMSWIIDPSGSIEFIASSPIGTVLLTASDPDGLIFAGIFFSGEPIRLLHILIHDIPSFNATWSSDGTWTSVGFTTAPSTSLGDLEFAISTSETSYVTVSGAEENRGMIYNDDVEDLGNGIVMEASIWLHVEDISRAELAFGGTSPTTVVGFGAPVANELRMVAQFDRTSDLNPAGANDDVLIVVVTTALPTEMDVSVTPSEEFDYVASANIAHVDIDAWIGDLSPMAPDPADVDQIELDVYNIPESVAGQWSLTSDEGYFHVQLAEGTTLDLIELKVENEFGAFGSGFKRVRAFIDELPENVNVDWDVGEKRGTIAFTDAGFGGGLGEVYLLATTMNEADTTAYINSLDNDPSVCMTSYSTYEQEIDERYWPGSTLENNLYATYCRNPELNTAADDYVVYRVGGGKLVTARIRELHEIDVNLGSAVAYGELEFTPGVYLNRELYIRNENVGGDDLVLVELSELPDGPGQNRFYADFDLSTSEYGFEASEEIEFIDIYTGTRSPTSKTLKYNKILIADLPESAELSFDFGANEGFLLFEISDEFEVGFAIQKTSKRYAGWVELTGISFDYELYGPGHLESEHDIGYYIAHIDIDIHTLPEGSDNEINGVVGLYILKSNPDDLDPYFEAPHADQHIPRWTFMLCHFTQFLLYVDWDVGISVQTAPPKVKVGLFPTIDIDLDFSLVIDYWWNSGVTLSLDDIGPLPSPPCPPPTCYITGSVHINPDPDYTINSPIHLLPFRSAWGSLKVSVPDDDWDFHPFGTLDPFRPFPYWDIVFHVNVDIPGFHDTGDHCDF